MPGRLRRALSIAAAAVVAWLIAGAMLPVGLPLGVVLLGVVMGSLTALTAMGLVLVYRSTRIINFAQAEIGGLAAAVAVTMVTGWHLPYFAALPVGLGVAVGTGALIDAAVVRRFFTAPRLILTVATIGLAQILGAGQIALPNLFAHLKPLSTFSTPFHFTFQQGPLIFNGDHVLVVIVVPLVLAGLAWFFARSDTGIAVRAAADSNERALLLGIPVTRLSRVTWMVAAGLSGIASMLSAPIFGTNLGGAGGPTLLLAPLAAAVVAGMESLPIAVGASVGIGVFQQVVFWNWPRSSTVDVALFAVILVALLLRRRRVTRVDDGGLGGYVAVREVRPIPAALRRLPEVRLARAAAFVAVALLVVGVPLTLSDTRLTLASYMAIFGIIAVSLVVLTGWAGQISLGQFAFVGVGAATTGALIVHAGADLFICLLASAVVGALVAVLVGIPALRIPGLFLAVTTLAFAVPVSTFLLNAAYFPSLTPTRVQRPPLLQRFTLDSPRTFYFFCLVWLVVAVVLARNFRRSRPGRAAIGVRDNPRAAAAYAIHPVRAKLTAFAFSGGLAGLAGGLYVVGLRSIGFSGFSPEASLQVFTMVVVGGLGSLSGALLGAVYVEAAQWWLRGAAQLLATGAGLLLLLMVAPGGLGEIAFGVRDRALRRLARRRGLPFGPQAEPAVQMVAPATTSTAGSQSGLVSVEGVDASYGQMQVLFSVDLDVPDGDVVALLGTNGAGKSTVLRVIAGLLPPSRGRVLFEGRDITKLSPVERVKAGLVTVPGGRGVFGSLTVAENLRLAGWLRRHDTGYVTAATEAVLDLFPTLRDRLTTRAADLSGGEQQMVTLAQALMCRPRLLMIDELSLGLAPAVVASLLAVVRRVNAEGTTVVVVEQSVNIATELARQAVFMEKGQVRFTGATADLMGRDDLVRSVFLRDGTAAGARPRVASSDGSVTTTEPRLVVESVRRSYGGITAVDGVDLEVAPGRILGIIGTNGAGKTTLFDVCSGFLPADGGRILLEGRDVTALAACDRSAYGLGRSFQDARLFPSLTVAEALAISLERHIEVREPLACIFRVGAAADSEAAVTKRVDELLELTNLERYRDAFISELSTGTRRIVELACAMAHDPSVLLLDEPSSGIAQRECEALAQLLLDVRDRTGASLVVIEHDIPMISSIADELVCLHLGRVLARGTPSAVLRDPAVVASYLGTDDVAVARSGARPAVVSGTAEVLLTTAEYAEAMGLRVEAVRRQIRAGHLEATRTSRGYLVRPPA